MLIVVSLFFVQGTATNLSGRPRTSYRCEKGSELDLDA